MNANTPSESGKEEPKKVTSLKLWADEKIKRGKDNTMEAIFGRINNAVKVATAPVYRLHQQAEEDDSEAVVNFSDGLFKVDDSTSFENYRKLAEEKDPVFIIPEDLRPYEFLKSLVIPEADSELFELSSKVLKDLRSGSYDETSGLFEDYIKSNPKYTENASSFMATFKLLMNAAKFMIKIKTVDATKLEKTIKSLDDNNPIMKFMLFSILFDKMKLDKNKGVDFKKSPKLTGKKRKIIFQKEWMTKLFEILDTKSVE